MNSITFIGMIKISVIIPVYNKCLYLSECLESVLNQTLSEKEIICVNDGSDDGSERILQEFGERYPELIIINQVNSGVSRARNMAIKLARGEYIAFIDADDYYPTKNVLELLYETAKSQGVLICGGSYSQDVEGEIIEYYEGEKSKNSFKCEKLIEYNSYQYVYGFTRFIYNRYMLQEKGILFPLYTNYEDPPFLLKCMLTAEKFYAVPDVVYRHRRAKTIRVCTSIHIKDLIKGLTDVLVLSHDYDLKHLHSYIIQALHGIYYSSLCQELLKGDQEVIGLLERLNSAIDQTMLQTFLMEDQNPYLDIEEMLNDALKGEAKKQALLKTIRGYNKIIIYGAGAIANKVMEFLECYKINIIGFAVTDHRGNTKRIGKVEVKLINELVDYKDDALIIVSMLDRYHEEATSILNGFGFKHVIMVGAKDIIFM